MLAGFEQSHEGVYMDTAKGGSSYSKEKVACIHFTSLHLICCFTGSSVSP